jgi:arylsulfatase A-like enzyme
MMIHVPWLPSSHGARTRALVEAVDLMPTLLALSGVTTDPLHKPSERVWDIAQLEGTSLVPVLKAPATWPAEVDAGSVDGGVYRSTPAGWKNATFTQVLQCTVLYCTVSLYCVSVLCLCTVLYCTVLYCIAVQCTAVY